MGFEEFWASYGTALEGLGIYAAGIAVYTLVVGGLYGLLAQRVMFGRKNGDARETTKGRTFLFVLLFPLVSFAFFLIVAASLLFLSSSASSTLAPLEVFTISMATVLAIRLCAYANESVAHELAKIMPLGLLGVILVTNKVTSFGDSIAQLGKILEHADVVALYFVVVVVVELLLRAGLAIVRKVRGHHA